MKNKREKNIFEIFLPVPPGLEEALLQEVRYKGFKSVEKLIGGVSFMGGWPEVYRANLWIRGASCVLARIAKFKASHFAQLDEQAHRVKWQNYFSPEITFNVDVTCAKSRLYHSGAVAERVAHAVQDVSGAIFDKNGAVSIKVRIENDLCVISLDTSGELLHKRGAKQAINSAPMRENLAALFLLSCGFKGDEPVYDPMCGSGTFVLEAAEIALGLNPGRMRHFAFEKFANFDAETFIQIKQKRRKTNIDFSFCGSDRDCGAIQMAMQNAQRAGVADFTKFDCLSVSECIAPAGKKGLVIINPPYGKRIGDLKKLSSLYASMGKMLKSQFSGWRVGLITTDKRLAAATGLNFLPPKIATKHGGLNVQLFITHALS